LKNFTTEKKLEAMPPEENLGNSNGDKRYVPPLLIPPGCKCSECGDTGYREYWLGGYRYVEQCHCYQQRVAQLSMAKAGVNQDYTFDNFVAQAEHQKQMLMLAKRFVDCGCDAGDWYYIGGQVGSGKTHICTAIINKLIQFGKEVRYMAWVNTSIKLKSLVASAGDEYDQHLMQLCKVPVLYIDDFYKSQPGRPPTPADKQLAFQLINYRYQNPSLVTIISSELPIAKVTMLDEAVGSRIFERCRNYLLFNELNTEKNYRLREE
jgi:DNA replication protein DnaC